MGRGKTILLVDDTKWLRLLLQSELEDAGYSLITVGTGQKGWDILQQDAAAIDLVITDGRHPPPDGLELLQRIKAKWPNLPVILHSAFSSYQFDPDRCFPDEYIVKDPDLIRLKEAVGRQIGG